MSQPRLSQLDTWSKMEKKIHTVLDQALDLLTREDELPEQENKITRKLYFCLLRADRNLKRSSTLWHSLPPPYCEANNQPFAEDEEKSTREDKRPDVQYGFYDEDEPDDLLSAKQYIIECKRLGKKVRSNWALNENYIQYGIMRFISEEHAYGKGVRSGAMIGYVQNMEPEDILSEVNAAAIAQHLQTLSDPSIMLSEDGWKESNTSQLRSEFERTFPYSPFLLYHFWVDLRTHYLPSNSITQSENSFVKHKETPDENP